MDRPGTLILTFGPLKGGTALTVKYAEKLEKPHFVVDLKRGEPPSAILRWGEKNNIEILNVAGPRESGVPGIHDKVADYLLSIPSLEPDKERISYGGNDGQATRSRRSSDRWGDVHLKYV